MNRMHKDNQVTQKNTLRSASNILYQNRTKAASLVVLFALSTLLAFGCEELQPNDCPIDYNQNGHIALGEGLQLLSDPAAQQTLVTDTNAQQACSQLTTDADSFLPNGF